MPTKKIILSEQLKEVLTKIDSEISKTLLKNEVDEKIITTPEKNFNYIDLSTSVKGHLSYLTQEKIDKINQQDPPYNFWDAKMRYHSRPGSLIKKLFNSYNGQEIENFSTQMLSILDPPTYRMEIVKGEDIAKYYNYNSYSEQNGSLGNSCMKGVDESYFYLYVHNSEVISMLIMLNQHDKLMGRAILWRGDNFNVMDRVYTTTDSFVHYFTDWAKENKYYYKEYNNCFSPKHMKYDGDKKIVEFKINLKKSKFDKYPYLDTFKWLDTKKNTIHNYIPNNVENVIVVSDHMGGYHKNNMFGFCEMSNYLYSASDLTYLQYLKKNVYYGDVNRSKINCCYIYNKHCIFDKKLNDYIFNEEYDRFNKFEEPSINASTSKKKIIDRRIRRRNNSFLVLGLEMWAFYSFYHKIKTWIINRFRF